MPDFPLAELDRPIGFDPYRAWLGVRELRRPLNFYQLLLLPNGEEDLEVIHAAAAAQRASLLAHRHDALPEVWRQVRDELEEAIDTLTDPDRKAAYDLALQNAASTGAPATIGSETTERGTMLRCRRCRSMNPATRKFCAQCGLHLWEPCIRCNTICASGEKFCGACGANIENAIASEVERIESLFASIATMQAESRFDEAIDQLATISRIEHPRLVDWAKRAGEMIRQLAAQRDRRKVTADEKLAEAQAMVARNDYLGALTLLRTVADALRTDAVRALIAECSEKIDEIESLERDLQTAVASKRFEGVLPKIERLLSLKPDHALARQLAAQIQDHLCRGAEKLAAERQFEKALQWLEQVPPALRSEKLSSLVDRVAETAYMLYDLRNAPYIDDTLLEMAARCRKRMPDDEKLAKICAQMAARAGALRQAAYAPVAWAAAPAETPFGMPVDWLWRLTSVVPAESCDTAVLGRHPGGFLSAAGMALQVLGIGPVKINLLPADYHSVFGRVKQLMRFRGRSAWGIDVSRSGIKAVKLTPAEPPHAATIEAAICVPHRKPLNQAVNDAEEERLIDESLKQLFSSAAIGSDRVGVAFSSRWLLLRQFKLPPIDVHKLPALVEFESRVQVPIALEELVWGFQTIDEFAAAPDDAKASEKAAIPRREYEVVVAAVKRALLARLLARFQSMHVYVDAAQADALALYNAVFVDRFERGGEAASAGKSNGELRGSQNGNLLIVDIGADSSNAIACGPKLLWTRSLGVGGQSYTRALVQQFNLTFQQAEELKQQPFKAPLLYPVFKAMAPVHGDLTAELGQCIDMLVKSFPGCVFSRMLVTGGGARLHGLLRMLRTGR